MENAFASYEGISACWIEKCTFISGIVAMAHKGVVYCHGDATGGAQGSARVQGSDWQLVRAELSPVFGRNLNFRFPQANPKERVRINAVNSRLRAADGTIRMMIDPVRCPNVVKDFEGVRLLEGGSGEIDKKIDPHLSHLSDSIGYYISKEFPLRTRSPPPQHRLRP
jgi:hypothetical protein